MKLIERFYVMSWRGACVQHHLDDGCSTFSASESHKASLGTGGSDQLSIHITIGGGLFSFVTSLQRQGCRCPAIFTQYKHGWQAPKIRRLTKFNLGLSKFSAVEEWRWFFNTAHHVPAVITLARKSVYGYRENISSLVDPQNCLTSSSWLLLLLPGNAMSDRSWSWDRAGRCPFSTPNIPHNHISSFQPTGTGHGCFYRLDSCRLSGSMVDCIQGFATDTNGVGAVVQGLRENFSNQLLFMTDFLIWM